MKKLWICLSRTCTFFSMYPICPAVKLFSNFAPRVQIVHTYNIYHQELTTRAQLIILITLTRGARKRKRERERACNSPLITSRTTNHGCHSSASRDASQNHLSSTGVLRALEDWRLRARARAISSAAYPLSLLSRNIPRVYNVYTDLSRRFVRFPTASLYIQ